MATTVEKRILTNRYQSARGGEARQSTRPDVTDERIIQSWEVPSTLLHKFIQGVLLEGLPPVRQLSCAGKSRPYSHHFRGRARRCRRVVRLNSNVTRQRRLVGTCEGQWLHAASAGNRRALGPQNLDSLECMELSGAGSKISVDISCMCNDKIHRRRALSRHIFKFQVVFQA